MCSKENSFEYSIVSLPLWMLWLESSKVDSMVNAEGAPTADHEAWSLHAYPERRKVVRDTLRSLEESGRTAFG